MANHPVFPMGAAMSKNDITGDNIVSRASTKAFDEGFERIFGKKIMLSDTYGKIKAEVERECCGTFHDSPHRKTCEKWKGK